MSTAAAVPLLNTSFVTARNHRTCTGLAGAGKHFASPCKLVMVGGSIRRFRPRKIEPIKACSSTAVADSTISKVAENGVVVHEEKFVFKRTKTVEGKLYIRMDHGDAEDQWHLTVGCTLPGIWILHWGVHYIGDVGSEWDQPPDQMRPPGSVAIKDYAIETPLKEVSSSNGGGYNQEVKIEFSSSWSIAAINFVLKDAETGSWYQHKGRDFKVPLVDSLHCAVNLPGVEKSFGSPGAFGQIPKMLLGVEDSKPKSVDQSEQSALSTEPEKPLEGFDVEQHMVKEDHIDNSVSVTVRKCPDTAKNYVFLETDISEDVVIHWGVCKDEAKKWEIPAAPYPPDTEAYKNKALRTKLQQKEDGDGRTAIFTVEENLAGFLFVLKLENDTWLNCKGDDFFIPLPISASLPSQFEADQSNSKELVTSEEVKQEAPATEYADGIIKELRNLATDISSDRMRTTKSKEAKESILREIEKLAAEAYGIFRSSLTKTPREPIAEPEVMEPEEILVSSGTGSGYEILCQGFNWESHKSGRWYEELDAKVAELSSMGFTIIWLPPPTDSVSPEGYMPRDLYNLNSRYGSFDELKSVVKKFHDAGIKVLGDAVLNHRCAQSQNQNGIWNIFGGKLDWDDRAVVADDPHFQGRGNKSSGDNFHAAPNIDHSQDFVRNDIKEWLRWLRKDIGYDGWRLDFVRGFWGGYVKDYFDSSVPYFAVGEYWDSLKYTYDKMDHNQDAHRQRIVDWINATGGTAGAFDVTTKGILHAALERCEYWRLSDESGKPPGVVGWWPSRAVTFIENHDTGSTQGHWRFPGGKEMQGYAYILTHPGTPTVFYDHIFSHYNPEIKNLISVRNRNKVNCRSTVRIVKSEKEVYAAIIDDKVAMKIGPGHYEPPNDQNWSTAAEGDCYKVWEAR